MITSPSNKRVVKAARLKKRAMREKDRRFLVEGGRAVREALASGAVIHDLFMTPASGSRANDGAFDAAPVRLVSDDVMRQLTSTVTPQGIVAVAEFMDVTLDAVSREARCVPVLAQVRDPGNAGTIVRSADAAGADAVVFTTASVDIYNPKTIRASAGSVFHLPVVREVTTERAVEELSGRGFNVLAASAKGDLSVYDVDFSRPTAVLFGNEAEGVAAEASSLADAAVRIPILGEAESLNVAAAATIVLFESARRREGDPSLSSIIAAAAHDIRSPLAALRGFLSTLLSRWDRLTDEQRLTMLDAMRYDSVRMGAIVAQLVDAARVASGTVQLALAPADLLEVCQRIQEEMSGWGSVEVLVQADAEDQAVVLGDRERLRTILMGMVEAAGWWGEDGPVLVEVSAGPPVTVNASRSGTSLPPGETKDVLKPRKPGAGGSKLGLFVAEGLARAHGGSLEVSVNGNVRVTLTLPHRTPRDRGPDHADRS